MNVLIACLLVALILPYIVKIFLIRAIKIEGQGYDNHHPRRQQAQLTGYGARVVAAHQNSFESLIVFSSAVLTALATQTITPVIEFLAVFHIFCRVTYTFCYLKDLASLRSLVWSVGLIASLGILVICMISINSHL